MSSGLTRVRSLPVSSTRSSLVALTLGAIGVVYGDIGTSVLYAMKEVFGSGHVPFTHDNVYGILSIFFWTLTTIVSVKYVVLVLRADNHGEGGLVAMLALASQSVKDRPQLRKVLLVVGIFGTCLFYGDGVITPAISVLSAVEGLEVISPAFKKYVIPLTLVILFGLFWVQKRGTAGIGQFFGPITLVWFVTIAVLGVSHIVHHPEILFAISPHYALGFMWNEPGTTFIILGAVVLCVTGGEALYADMGHFGKKPIRLAWFSVVMPCLTLNYFGQGALLLAEPEAVKNPFFMMAPDWALLPLVGLATMATVIASQALISGAFSVTKQVIQLGYLPRLQVLHTSETDTGQIYMPFVNWGLFTAIVLAVVMFKSSSNLAAAYGIAVCTDMLITTVLTFFVIRYAWKLPLALCIGATGFFFVVDLAFWASNLLKLFDGGWFPLLIGAAVFTLMLTWHDGRSLLNESLRSDALKLNDFLEAVFVAPPPPGRGHGGVPHGRARLGAQCLAAQPQAQQGAAPAQPVCDGAQPRSAAHGCPAAPGSDPAGSRLLAGHRELRLQGQPGPAIGLGHHRRRGLPARPDDDQLFPVTRHRDPDHRRRHGHLARKTLRPNAPQRQRCGRVLEPADQRGGRAGLQDRNLTPQCHTRLDRVSMTSGYLHSQV